MTHTQAAVEFLELVVARRVREAFARHVGAGFRHHNPYFAGDAESLMAAMEANGEANQDLSLTVQRTLEDGTLVAVHSWIRPKPQDAGMAVVHIFRFDGDLIVEAWDIGQAIPAPCPNEHGMF